MGKKSRETGPADSRVKSGGGGGVVVGLDLAAGTTTDFITRPMLERGHDGETKTDVARLMETSCV